MIPARLKHGISEHDARGAVVVHSYHCSSEVLYEGNIKWSGGLVSYRNKLSDNKRGAVDLAERGCQDSSPVPNPYRPLNYSSCSHTKLSNTTHSVKERREEIVVNLEINSLSILPMLSAYWILISYLL